DLDSPIGHGAGKPARRRDVSVVELARDEGEWKLRQPELIPDRLHHARAHPAQRAGKTRRMVLEALRAHLREEGRSATLQSGKQRKAAPVVDEGPDAISLDAIGKRLVAATPPVASAGVQAGVRADGEHGKDAVTAACRDMEGEPAAHRVADEVRALDAEMVPQHL